MYQNLVQTVDFPKILFEVYTKRIFCLLRIHENVIDREAAGVSSASMVYSVL